MSKRVLLRVLPAVLLLCHSLWLCAAIPAQERAALIALYQSTQGDGWLDKTGWKTAPPTYRWLRQTGNRKWVGWH